MVAWAKSISNTSAAKLKGPLVPMVWTIPVIVNEVIPSGKFIQKLKSTALKVPSRAGVAASNISPSLSNTNWYPLVMTVFAKTGFAAVDETS